jgi:histidyl-tRNA synthetase
MQKKEFNIKSKKPIVICVFDKNSIAEYIKLQNQLRTVGISVEIYSGDGNLKTQMKYADKLGSPAVIFYGDDEIKSGKVTLKNLKSGQEISTQVENLTNEIKKLL